MESVFVTGSNRGLGYQFVKQILELENPPKYIFAACRDPGKAKDLLGLKTKYSGKTDVHILKLEVTDACQLATCVKETEKILGDQGLTVLINNAGIMPQSSFPNITAKEYQNHFQVNCVGPMMVSQAFLPLLKLSAARNGSGDTLSSSRAAIFNLGAQIASFSVVNFEIWCKVDVYRMAKAAFHMGSAIQARELRPHGILVLTVHPGWVATDLGGPLASLSPEDSVKGMINILNTGGNEQHGEFIDYEGKPVPW